MLCSSTTGRCPPDQWEDAVSEAALFSFLLLERRNGEREKHCPARTGLCFLNRRGRVSIGHGLQECSWHMQPAATTLVFSSQPLLLRNAACARLLHLSGRPVRHPWSHNALLISTPRKRPPAPISGLVLVSYWQQHRPRAGRASAGATCCFSFLFLFSAQLCLGAQARAWSLELEKCAVRPVAAWVMTPETGLAYQ